MTIFNFKKFIHAYSNNDKIKATASANIFLSLTKLVRSSDDHIIIILFIYKFDKLMNMKTVEINLKLCGKKVIKKSAGIPLSRAPGIFFGMLK
jgi:hypothetical protein